MFQNGSAHLEVAADLEDGLSQIDEEFRLAHVLGAHVVAVLVVAEEQHLQQRPRGAHLAPRQLLLGQVGRRLRIAHQRPAVRLHRRACPFQTRSKNQTWKVCLVLGFAYSNCTFVTLKQPSITFHSWWYFEKKRGHLARALIELDICFEATNCHHISSLNDMGNTTEGQILTRSLMALLAHRRNKKKRHHSVSFQRRATVPWGRRGGGAGTSRAWCRSAIRPASRRRRAARRRRGCAAAGPTASWRCRPSCAVRAAAPRSCGSWPVRCGTAPPILHSVTKTTTHQTSAQKKATFFSLSLDITPNQQLSAVQALLCLYLVSFGLSG